MTESPGCHLPARAGPPAWFLNPYVQIVIGALLDATGEVLLKKGATAAPHVGGIIQTFGLTGLLSLWTWIGIVTYLLSFVCWLAVLRRLPLSIAYPLINIVQALVPLGAWWILGETISAQRWTSWRNDILARRSGRAACHSARGSGSPPARRTPGSRR